MTPQQRARMREIVGAALGRAVLPAPAAPPPAAGRAASTPDVARFRAELEALAGVVHTATSPGEIAAIVSRLADRLPTRSVLAWSEDALGVPGLYAALEAAGLALVPTTLDHRGPQRAGQVAAVAAASIGLTGSDAALSATGSIIVASGPGRPRLASLLTPIHVALVRVATIVETVPALIAARPDLVTQGSNFVCITGPSRTADIEHTLSRGVHGPGEVHVVLLDET